MSGPAETVRVPERHIKDLERALRRILEISTRDPGDAGDLLNWMEEIERIAREALS